MDLTGACEYSGRNYDSIRAASPYRTIPGGNLNADVAHDGHDVLELRSNSPVSPLDSFDSLHLTTAGRGSDTRGCEEVPQTLRPSDR
jgi:hypothetical protein